MKRKKCMYICVKGNIKKLPECDLLGENKLCFSSSCFMSSVERNPKGENLWRRGRGDGTVTAMATLIHAMGVVPTLGTFFDTFLPHAKRFLPKFPYIMKKESNFFQIPLITFDLNTKNSSKC